MFMINYVYLLFDMTTKECALVDPSWEVSKIENIIIDYGLKLKYILLTHSHFDHVNKAGYFSDKYGAKIVISSDESVYYGFKHKNAVYINDNEILDIGDIQIRCILCPGHSVGSMCYLCDKYLFSGDTLFAEGCGYCLGEGGDSHKMFFSIKKLKKILKPETIIYSGHKFLYDIGMTFAEAMEHNIYLNIDNENTFCNFRDRSNQNKIMDFK